MLACWASSLFLILILILILVSRLALLALLAEGKGGGGGGGGLLLRASQPLPPKNSLFLWWRRLFHVLMKFVALVAFLRVPVCCCEGSTEMSAGRSLAVLVCFLPIAT